MTDLTGTRKAANRIMRELNPKIDWHIHCVHHKDQNPFNNSLDNLEIMTKKEHTLHHRNLVAIQRVIHLYTW